jgi:type VI secretion system protein ImpC
MPRDRADVRLDVSAGAPVESPVAVAGSDGGGRAVAIVGDLSGRDARPPDPDDIPLAERRPIPIDRDVLNDVLAALAPRAVVDIGVAGAAPFELTFRSLDDFHPDQLLDRVPLLAALDGRAPAPEQPRDAPAAEAPPAGGLLDRILDATPDTRVAAAAAGDDLSAFIARVVARHVVHEPGAAERAAARERDEVRTRVLRMVLRAEGVRRLESVWRALDVLVRRVETGADLRLYALDVSRTELLDDLAANPRPEDSAVVHVLGRATATLPSDVRWGMFVGLYTCGLADADLALLGRLGEVGRRSGAGWLAEARPWGDRWPDLDERDEWEWTAGAAWSEARRGPAAGWVGLALPGFLLRPPYGAAGEPCERFAFEELADPADGGAYLWGPAALACAAAVLGEGPRRGPVQLDGLPVHAVGDTFQGCVEVSFTEEQAARLLDAGLVPIVSPRGSDQLLVRGLRAIGEPPGAVPGWGSR